MKLSEIIEALENLAPSAFQESYDNSGLQIGNHAMEVNKGLVCIDVTPEVVQEAVELGCDLIITHHPLIFGGLKRITGSNSTEKVVVEAIKNNIAILSVHTNLDNIVGGVNSILGEMLGLDKLQVLKPNKGLLRKLVTFCPEAEADRVRAAIFAAGAGQIGQYDCCSFNTLGKGSFRAGEGANPFVGKKNEIHFEPEVKIETILPSFLVDKVASAMIESHPYEEVAYDVYPLENQLDQVGSGMVGEFSISRSEPEFLELIKTKLKIPCVRHTRLRGGAVKKVAFCGGAGSFLLTEAIASGAQAFVTADIKYHQFFDAEGKILLVDAGHYETEQFTNQLLYDVVSKNFTNFALAVSKKKTNPVNYF